MMGEGARRDPRLDMNDTWDLMTQWSLVLPPSRPDELDLARIAARLQRVDRAEPVGVLGSTPEFRDLLAESGFSEVFVLDRNEGFLRAMTGSRVYETPETIVISDWLDSLPEYEGFFGVILSDLTSGNLPYDERRRFNSLVALALRPAGLFIDKILTNESGLLSIDQIRVRYERASPNLKTANYFSCEAIFCSELQCDGERVETSRVYDRLTAELPGRRFAALIDVAQLVTPRGGLWHYGRPWSTLRVDYGVGLELEGRFDLAFDQPYYGRGYQYFWRKGTAQ